MRWTHFWPILMRQERLAPGYHAVVITPNYQAAETVPLASCDVTGVPLDGDRGWALDLDQVAAALRPETRLVSINVPNNPTGAARRARIPSSDSTFRVTGQP